MHFNVKHNIILNHGVRKVLDLLDLTFADFVELHGTFRKHLDFPTTWIVILMYGLFSSNKEGK